MSELINWYFEATHSTWYTLVFDILYYSMWFAVLNGTHPLRFRRWISLVSEFLFMFIFIVVFTRLLPFMSVVRTFLSYGFLFIFCFIIYKDSKAKISLTLSLLLILNVLNEMLGAAVYFPAEAMAGRVDLLNLSDLMLRLYVPYLTIGGISCLLLYVFLNHVSFNLNIRNCVLLAMFPLSQYMLITGWLRLLTIDRSPANTIFFLSMMALCLASDVALFAVIRSVARRAQLESQALWLGQLLEEQGKHYEALTAQYEDIRRMRHDISKYIDTAESLIRRGEQDEARLYLAELKDASRSASVSFCQHPVADAFLSSRIKAAAALGIETEFSGNIRSDVSVSSLDLIQSLGNLLENAYESCQNAGGSSVSLKCAETGGCLVVITENPADPVPVKREARIPGLERGVGTRVLSDIAAKYEGSFRSEQEGELHRACLVLKA